MSCHRTHNVGDLNFVLADGKKKSMLGMYDFPEVLEYTDKWYQTIKESCIEVGINENDIPIQLDRSDLEDIGEVGSKNNLFLGQTCGLPLLYSTEKLRVIAVPRYNCQGCNESNDGSTGMSSMIIVHKDSPIESLLDLDIKSKNETFTAAVNSRSSMSGNLLLNATLKKNIMDTLRIIYTGAHEASAIAVGSGKADIAAIDCVTFSILSKYKPNSIKNIRILTQSPQAPPLPYVTSINSCPNLVKMLKEALKISIIKLKSQSNSCIEALFIEDFDINEDNEVDMYREKLSYLQDLGTNNININESSTIDDILLNIDINDKNNEIKRIQPLLSSDKIFAEILLEQVKLELKINRNKDISAAYWRRTMNNRVVRVIFPHGYEVAEDLFKINSDSLNEINCICFLGTRPSVQNCDSNDFKIVEQCWASDNYLTENIDTTVVAYVTGEYEIGGEWGNLVVFSKNKTVENFCNRNKDLCLNPKQLLGYQTHDKAINEIAPLYYSKIRIHRGILKPLNNEFNIILTTSIRYNKIDMNVTTRLDNIQTNRIVIKWDEYKVNSNIITDNNIINYNTYLDSLVDIEGGPTGLVPPNGYTLDQLTLGVLYDNKKHINLINTNSDNINNNSVNIFNILSNEGRLVINNEIERLDSLFKLINNNEITYKMLSCVTFRSRFIQDLSLDIKLNQLIGLASGFSLIPHPMVYNHGTIYKFAEEINMNNLNLLLNNALNNNASDRLIVIFLNNNNDSNDNDLSDTNKEIIEGGGFIFHQNNIINNSYNTKCRDILILKYIDNNIINNNLYIIPTLEDDETIIPNHIKISSLCRYYCWNLQRIIMKIIRFLNIDYFDLTKELIKYRVCLLETCQRLFHVIKTLPYSNNKVLIKEELLYAIKGESSLDMILLNVLNSDFITDQDMKEYSDYLIIIQNLISNLL